MHVRQNSVAQELSTTTSSREPLLSAHDIDEEAPVLADRETTDQEHIANLDTFFTQLYCYWLDKGFWVSIVSRLLNLLALAFTVLFSGFLLLFIDWHALRSECLLRDTCDIARVAIRTTPWFRGNVVWVALKCLYLVIFCVYTLWTAFHFVVSIRELMYLRHFCRHKLGMNDAHMKCVTWPELVHRVVLLQRRTRLCVIADLDEHLIVNRIMRRDNFLIGMLNKGVLALSVKLPCARKRIMLTQTLEWNLYWCILNPMFDDNSRIRPEFLSHPHLLTRRLRLMALVNLVLAPFVLMFLIIHFFMSNAEKFYNNPASVGARRWTLFAQWKMREFNELPHYIQHRLNAGQKPALEYINQFPSYMNMHVARFVAFVFGSFAALVLFVTLADDTLLERHFHGRTLVWWAAVLGVVVAVSRSMAPEEGTAYDPEAAMIEVVRNTHYLPRHWRGRAHTREVREHFQSLFQFKALLFVEELASVILTPYILWFKLPHSVDDIVHFVRDFAVDVDGVGDVCSLAVWAGSNGVNGECGALRRHGNAKYGAAVRCDRVLRSQQGKLEKSVLTFATTYPTWHRPADVDAMLNVITTHHYNCSMHGYPPPYHPYHMSYNPYYTAYSPYHAPYSHTGTLWQGAPHPAGHAWIPSMYANRWLRPGQLSSSFSSSFYDLGANHVSPWQRHNQPHDAHHGAQHGGQPAHHGQTTSQPPRFGSQRPDISVTEDAAEESNEATNSGAKSQTQWLSSKPVTTDMAFSTSCSSGVTASTDVCASLSGVAPNASLQNRTSGSFGNQLHQRHNGDHSSRHSGGHGGAYGEWGRGEQPAGARLDDAGHAVHGAPQWRFAPPQQAAQRGDAVRDDARHAWSFFDADAIAVSMSAAATAAGGYGGSFCRAEERVAASHSMLQGFYESQDDVVQHQIARQHAWHDTSQLFPDIMVVSTS